MKPASLKRASTLFLKAVIILIGVAVLALCVFLFPMIGSELLEVREFSFVIYSALAGIYASALPFFFALYQAFKLLQNIDTNNAFSESSINALRFIKFSAVAMTICYAAALPLVYLFAELDDAPGAILMGTAFACAPLVVATFAAVLQMLVRSALDMKTENDLTV